MNLHEIFLKTAAKQPDHPVIITAEGEYTYRSFQEQVQRLIETLRAIGIVPGDCIALHYPSGPEYIKLTYAIWGCGACAVPIPVELSAQEKQHIFHNICIDAAISKLELLGDIEAAQSSAAVSLFEGARFFRAIKFRTPPTGVAGINPAFVRFSSGTTGAAKGVVLSHETIYKRIHAANEALAIGPDDRIVWLLSMAYHFTVSIVAYITFGATILLCPNTFGATMVRTAARHKATILYAAPLHYMWMAQDRVEDLLPDVRLAVVTTTAVPPEVATAFYERFQKPLNETYGIIEVGLPCVNLGKPREKQGSVGRPLPAYEIQIDGRREAHHLGPIHIRGEGFVDAYYEPWQTRDDILLGDGWFVTGDVGELDEEGYLYIRGRSNEVISVAGMKFFPQEVERILESHPGIQEACVFRYPDQRLGEVAHAHLVRTPGAERLPSNDDLNAFCAEQLALHKVPAKFTFVDRLDRTASGKLIRGGKQAIASGKTEA